MNKLYAHNTFIREHFLVLIGFCICAYFTYHAVAGERSLVRLYLAEKQVETLSQKEAQLRAEQELWSRKVAMMRPGSVDKDLLEEQVRKTLAYRSADEIAVLSN